MKAPSAVPVPLVERLRVELVAVLSYYQQRAAAKRAYERGDQCDVDVLGPKGRRAYAVIGALRAGEN